MAYLPLKAVAAQYAVLPDGCEGIQFSWLWPTLCLDFVCAALIDDQGNIDKSNMVHKLVREVTEGKLLLSLQKTSGGYVTAMRFCVFMFDNAGIPNRIDLSPALICEVIVGRAKVTYRLQKPLRGLQDDLVPVTLRLTCSKAISANVVGYAFVYGGKEIEISLPALPHGKSKKYTIMIPRGCTLRVKAMNPAYAQNVEISM